MFCQFARLACKIFAPVTFLRTCGFCKLHMAVPILGTPAFFRCPFETAKRGSRSTRIPVASELFRFLVPYPSGAVSQQPLKKDTHTHTHEPHYLFPQFRYGTLGGHGGLHLGSLAEDWCCPVSSPKRRQSTNHILSFSWVCCSFGGTPFLDETKEKPKAQAFLALNEGEPI